MSRRKCSFEDRLAQRMFGFGTKQDESDIKFLFGEECLYVNRTVLEISSPAFKARFSSEKKWINKTEIRFDGDIKVFAEFLACFYPGKSHEVNAENLFTIIPLAFKYDIVRLKQRCETLLMDSLRGNTNEEYVYKCLAVANEHSIFTVKRTCLQMITTAYKEDIQRADELLTLPSDVKSNVQLDIIPVLRSEACKYRFLTADSTQYECFTDLTGFEDAKYSKMNFRVSGKGVQDEKPICEINIWGVNLKLGIVAYSSNEQYQLSSDKQYKACHVALKIIFKNNIPGKDDVIKQEKGENLPLSVKFPTTEIAKEGILWNNEFTVEMHVLISKPGAVIHQLESYRRRPRDRYD